MEIQIVKWSADVLYTSQAIYSSRNLRTNFVTLWLAGKNPGIQWGLNTSPEANSYYEADALPLR